MDAPKPVLLLAVDDEPANNDLMMRAFRAEKEVKLLVAYSGSEALEILGRTPVDVILVDYSMPGMNGVEFLSAARKVVPDVVAIMVTAFPEMGDVHTARSRGIVQHIISKPWQVRALVDTVKRAISMRAMRETVSRLSARDSSTK